ncbi:hypothetical protein LCGC14_0224440 [marine sediment metagenome]|uniref:Uncharacterized protein n=1 Tax=marine sediment metagenome TaxID=412755 RepID=A0A0F9UCG0_9ZZZZ
MKFLIHYFRIGEGMDFTQSFAYDSFEELEKKISGDMMKIIHDSGTKKLTITIEKII